MQGLSLLELNALVKKSIATCLPDEYWVQAEMSDVRCNAAGHCYLEFTQKDARNNNLVAKARGAIWSNVFRLLKPYFEEATGQVFASGIKVLVKVTVEFHELYGFNLTVHDIDPAYTVGDMVRHRREILKQLEAEGVLTLNKELEMPMLPRRIAVISSATAAGYGDFNHQLTRNAHGYCFHTELFPAIMQGAQVEDSILAALDAILGRLDEFDVVVIIRGGGATSDLSGFDTYMLAAACAQFPLPIITGIGHERDDTVLDSVAHTRVKTPTAAAEYLINRMHEAANQLYFLCNRLKESVARRLKEERLALAALQHKLPMSAFKQLTNARMALLTIKNKLEQTSFNRVSTEKHKLQLLRQRIADASPERLLQRGFSITLRNGKAVTDATMLQQGDVLTTRLAKGEVVSVVKD